jgi:5-deoxy-glucuronate isomerase
MCCRGAANPPILILGGKAVVDWGEGAYENGGRKDVFSGYPYAVYLQGRTPFEIAAVTMCEFADCRTPSSAPLSPRLIAAADCREETRGGGNCPRFPADKLMICEVYTPSLERDLRVPLVHAEPSQVSS